MKNIYEFTAVNATDFRIGHNMMTKGVFYKINGNNHFHSFGSIDQNKVVAQPLNSLKLKYDGNKVIVSW